MRTRLCYLALVLVPLVAYGAALGSVYGTPEDFLQLTREASLGTRHGILHGALVNISFFAVSSVPGFALVRGISVLLLILTGIALWQLLERGGWSELDACAVALCVVLLPSAQLFAGWGAAWPSVLAALLSLAGFAAAESELEPGGAKRSVGLLGGALLYFAAAMCFLPNSVMAIVALAALTLTRPRRVAKELGRWFATHVAVMLAGMLAAWAVDRWMVTDAGLADPTTLGERLLALCTFSLPSAGALFLVGESGALRWVGIGLALGVLAFVAHSVRRRVVEEGSGNHAWYLAVFGSFALFVVVALASAHFTGSYRTVWPLAALVIVVIATGIQGASVGLTRRPIWHHVGFAALVLLGVFAAAAQVKSYFAEPLGERWEQARSSIMRVHFGPETRVALVVDRATAQAPQPEASFEGTRFHAAAASRVFEALMAERFPSGLPKGQSVRVEVLDAPPTDRSHRLVLDFRR